MFVLVPAQLPLHGLLGHPVLMLQLVQRRVVGAGSGVLIRPAVVPGAAVGAAAPAVASAATSVIRRPRYIRTKKDLTIVRCILRSRDESLQTHIQLCALIWKVAASFPLAGEIPHPPPARENRSARRRRVASLPQYVHSDEPPVQYGRRRKLLRLSVGRTTRYIVLYVQCSTLGRMGREGSCDMLVRTCSADTERDRALKLEKG